MNVLGRPIVHVGYGVASIPKAVEQWSRAFGAGPFFHLEDVVFDELDVGGKPAEFEHSAAFGQWGQIGLELWEVHRFAPEDALGHRFGPIGQMNHVAIFTDDPEQESRRLEGLGFPRLLGGRVGSAELTLHDAPPLGHMIELQVPDDLVTGFYRDVADAARGWDGTDPLRPAATLLPGFGVAEA